jgi:hypothetical protein
MPEALEKWPVKVLGKLLPRHLEIIDKIDTIWKDSLKVCPRTGLLSNCGNSSYTGQYLSDWVNQRLQCPCLPGLA